MNNPLNWDRVRFFIEVARAGSVIKAAPALGVSHATVLRNIARLEQELGTKLFDRLQSGYRITSRGEDILQNALAMQEHAEALIRRASAKNPAPEGLLRLIVPDSSLFDLMGSLATFCARFPLISVRTEHAKTMAETDVAIVVTNTPPDQLVGRQLAKLEFAYYASPLYLAQYEGKAPALYKWVTWGSPETSDIEMDVKWQERSLRRFAKRPNIVLQTSSHNDALSATQTGVGISVLKRPQPDLIEVPLKPNIQPIGLWILTHQDLQRSGRIQTFMDFAVESFGDG